MENTAENEEQRPFATEPIGRLIVRFAVSSVIALPVNSLYNIVGQIFIGWGVGYLGNGATNVVFPVTIVALALAMIRADGSPKYAMFSMVIGAILNVILARRILKEYGEREQPVAQRLREKDKRRAAYHRFYTDMKWGYAKNYDLTLNSGTLGLDRCAEIIVGLF